MSNTICMEVKKVAFIIYCMLPAQCLSCHRQSWSGGGGMGTWLCHHCDSQLQQSPDWEGSLPPGYKDPLKEMPGLGWPYMDWVVHGQTECTKIDRSTLAQPAYWILLQLLLAAAIAASDNQSSPGGHAFPHWEKTMAWQRWFLHQHCVDRGNQANFFPELLAARKIN